MYQISLTKDSKLLDLSKFIELFPKGFRGDVYDCIRKTQHGNQEFTNDSIFIYAVNDSMVYDLDTGTNEDFYGIEKEIYLMAKPLGVMDEDNYILFNVSW